MNMVKVVFVLGSDRQGKADYIACYKENIIYLYEDFHLYFFRYLQGIHVNVTKPYTLIFPEAGLSPNEQLEFGSMLTKFLNCGYPHIIETHSENILLRVRKLVSQRLAKAEDYRILFFQDGQKSEIHINPDGSLTPGLPMSFFGCDLIEALEF